jgi:cytochrome P450 family 142 subfamily A polypeptide 1
MAAATLQIDLLDPELYRTNPHELWTQMRHESPVYRDEQNGLWALTKHHDLLEAERASDVFSSDGAYRAFTGPGESNMIAQDDPRHAAQRRLVLGRFTPTAIRKREPEMQQLIDELLDAVAEKGRMEVVTDVAAQLPSRLTARLLGFPEDEWSTIQGWSERLMRIDDRRNPESMQGLMEAAGDLFQRVTNEVPQKRACPMDDLLSVWSTSSVDGEELDVATVFHETGLFVSGGAETTRTLISHGLRTFVDHPDQWEAMAQDPSLVPSAVEELLRWVTPLNNMFRTTTRSVEVRGTTLAAGDRVMFLYPSANRDEEVFEDPFTFDIRRAPNPHLAFGNGTHFCLGATLARQLLKLLFTSLSARFTGLTVVSEPDVEPNLFARAVRSFELGFTVR